VARKTRANRIPTLSLVPTQAFDLICTYILTTFVLHGRYLLASHPDNTLSLHLVRSTGSSLTIDPGQRLYGHTSAVSSVQVDSRGKAVSINRNGLEMRVWELEGGISARRRVSASVKVEPVGIPARSDVTNDVGSGDRVTTTAEGYLGGFDEEKVVVLRGDTNCFNAAGTLEVACAEGRLALVVYDFNR
jgi:WD40 repeat protein